MAASEFKERFAFLFGSRGGDAAALVHPQEATYGAVRAAAWEVAAALRAAGGKPGGVVLPVLTKGLSFCAGYFGSLLAGMVPLLADISDAAQTAAAAGRAALVLAGRERAASLEGLVPRERIVLVGEGEGRSVAAGEAASAFGRDDPMTILLTSGSTGVPKESLKTFGNVLDELRLLGDLHRAQPSDVYWCAVPWVHIYGFLNGFLLPLSAGASIAAPGLFLPAEADRFLRRCTVLLAVPVQLKAIVETADFSGIALRMVFSSGAHLSRNLSRRFLERAGTAVTEIYGSTETGGFAWRRSPDDEGWTTLPGMSWKIGEDGELLIRSPLVTAAALEGAGAQDGWYPSGDCVQPLGGGTFRLTGRKGGIIKIGGKRVSVREIEEGIFSTGLVDDAVVVSYYSEEAGCDKVGAAVVLKTGVAATRTELRRRCCEHLAPAKVPDRIVLVERIPRSQTGKVHLPDIEAWMKRGRS